MADLGILSALLGERQSYGNSAAQLTALLGDVAPESVQARQLQQGLAGIQLQDSGIAALLGGLGGSNEVDSDPLLALLGGSLGGDLSALTGAQSQSDPLLALLGGGASESDPLLALLGGDLAGLTGEVPRFGRRPIPKPDPNNVKLATYDVNAIRQLGDSAVLGGNGDGKLTSKELGMAKTVLSLLSKISGNNNPTLKSISKAADTLSRAEVFAAIAGKDGESGQNASIGATDIVLAALSDKDRDLNTIHLNVKPAASKNPLEDLIALLMGQGAV
jgi:hypothetical protein